jgi:periplasmic divalent cation tolerance protein
MPRAQVHALPLPIDPMKLLAVYTTVAGIDAARRMARALVERKLAACAQIGEIESFYAWQGTIANEREFRILFKTTEARYAAVEAAIRELHDYELPAIHAVALEHVHAPYGRWIEEGCSP